MNIIESFFIDFEIPQPLSIVMTSKSIKEVNEKAIFLGDETSMIR